MTRGKTQQKRLWILNGISQQMKVISTDVYNCVKSAGETGMQLNNAQLNAWKQQSATDLENTLFPHDSHVLGGPQIDLSHTRGLLSPLLKQLLHTGKSSKWENK